MRNFLEQLLDLIYKKRCYFCKSSAQNSLMCDKCYDNIDFLPPVPVTEITDKAVYCASVYSKDVQKMIRGIKYHNQRELALYQAKLMAEFWENTRENNKKYSIVPVPLYKSREKKRKYNHIMLIAQEFAKIFDYEINEKLITRVKDTKPQYKLTKQEREKNLKDAFKVDAGKYNDENILILDDIFTTGSTLEEMIRELKKAGIEKITCYTTSCTESNT